MAVQLAAGRLPRAASAAFAASGLRPWTSLRCQRSCCPGAWVSTAGLSTLPRTPNLRKHRVPTQKVAGAEVSLPTDEALHQARGDSDVRREAKRLQARAQTADIDQLTRLLEELQKLSSSSGAKSSSSSSNTNDAVVAQRSGRVGVLGAAWDSVAARVIELSRLEEIRTLKEWAVVLGAFSRGEYSNPALLAEAEDALLQDNSSEGLVASAGSQEVVAFVCTVEKFRSPCSAALLSQCAGRLRASLPDECLEDVARFAMFVGAYARAECERGEVLGLVQHALASQVLEAQLLELPPHDCDEAVAELTLFCQVFGAPSKSLQLGEWFLQLAATCARRAKTVHLAEILPLLAAQRRFSAEADAAIRHVIRRRLPGILAPNSAKLLLPREVAKIVEAMAIARERDASTLMSLTKECYRLATRLDARALVVVAHSLAVLRLRQEVLMVELANNLLVRHRKALGDPDVAKTVLQAWGYLRVPHEAMFQAIRESAADDEELRSLLEHCSQMKAPGEQLLAAAAAKAPVAAAAAPLSAAV